MMWILLLLLNEHEDVVESISVSFINRHGSSTGVPRTEDTNLNIFTVSSSIINIISLSLTPPPFIYL